MPHNGHNHFYMVHAKSRWASFMNGYNFMACILTINRMRHDSILLFKFGKEGPVEYYETWSLYEIIQFHKWK